MPYATDNPTYRYGIVIHGLSYAPGDVTNPSHVIMAETLEDARRRLWFAARGNPRGITGEGTDTLDTPVFGDPGDGAYLYRVKRSDPGFSEVLDLEGDRARHAFAWLDADYPAYLLEFGPVWGYSPKLTRL